MSQTITRHLGRTDSGAPIALTSTLFSLPVAAVGGLVAGRHGPNDALHPSLAFLMRGWVRPGWGELALLALCGVIAGVGAYSLAQAYRAAPASTVAPFVAAERLSTRRPPRPGDAERCRPLARII